MIGGNTSSRLLRLKTCTGSVHKLNFRCGLNAIHGKPVAAENDLINPFPRRQPDTNRFHDRAHQPRPAGNPDIDGRLACQSNAAEPFWRASATFREGSFSTAR